MSDYCAFLANCLVAGEEISTNDDGSMVRDTIRWRLDGHQVVLRQNKEVAVGHVRDFKGRWVDTSRLVIERIEERNVASAKRIADDMAALLSFAGASPVRVFRHEYPMGSGVVSQLATVGRAASFRPPIEINHGQNVREFVQQCWPAYKRHRTKRKLAEMFDYLTTADSIALLEGKLIMMFVVLEALKKSYARTQHIPYKKGYYRKVSTPPNSNVAKEPIYGFEELLKEMLKAVGIRKGLKRITKLRNELIHSGLTQMPRRSRWRTYCDVHDLVRLYMLRLLGYSGNYFPYSEPRCMKEV